MNFYFCSLRKHFIYRRPLYTSLGFSNSDECMTLKLP